MEENKKYHYCRLNQTPDNWQWCYSAKEFQKLLKASVKNLVLEKMYISFEAYCNSTFSYRSDRSFLDLSFESGYVLLVFNKLAIEFALHVEGMVEYNFFSPEEINIEEVYDYAPDMFDNTYDYVEEIQNCFDAEYSGKSVENVKVGRTDCWGFSLKGFNEELADKAAKANDLPERICFYLVGGVLVQLICDSLEYCRISVKNEPVT